MHSRLPASQSDAMAPLKKKKGGGYLVVVCLVRSGVVGSSVQRLCRHPRLLQCCLSLQRSGSSNVWAKRINLTPCSASFKHNNLMVAFLNFSGFHLSCYYELFFCLFFKHFIQIIIQWSDMSSCWEYTEQLPGNCYICLHHR